MAGNLARLGAPGRHERPPGVDDVRRACLAMLTMLVLQYGLGIFLNLYVQIPAADRTASMMQEIASAPFALTMHATLGLSLIGVAVVLLIRTARLLDRALIVLAAIGLGSICGAFVAGELFVKNGGQPGTSFAMAMLTGVALLCYVATLALTSLAQRYQVPGHDEPDPDDAGYGMAIRPWDSTLIGTELPEAPAVPLPRRPQSRYRAGPPQRPAPPAWPAEPAGWRAEPAGWRAEPAGWPAEPPGQPWIPPQRWPAEPPPY